MFRTDRPGDDGDDDDEDDEDDEDDNDISQGTLQFDVSLDGNHTDEVAGDASSLDLSPTSLPFQPTKMQNDDDHDRRKKMINAGQQHHVHLPTHVPDSYITSQDVATVKEVKHAANSKHAKSQLRSTRPKRDKYQQQRQLQQQQQQQEKPSFASLPPHLTSDRDQDDDADRPHITNTLRSSTPGAVAVDGFNRDVSSSSVIYGDDEQNQSSTSHTSFPEFSATAAATPTMTTSLLQPAASIDPVLVAEIVNDDLIRREIAQQVRHELLQEAVQACVLVETDNADDSMSDGSDKRNIRHGRASVTWRRAAVCMFVTVVIIVGVVVGVVLSDAGKGNGARPTPSTLRPAIATTLSPSMAPTPSPARCGLCYDGVESVLSDLTLATVARTKQSCADLSTVLNELSPNDTTCTPSQADAWLYCGCPLLPPRPWNTSCTACSSGRARGSSVLCPKYDNYVAVVGNSEATTTCQRLKNNVVFARNCTCWSS